MRWQTVTFNLCAQAGSTIRYWSPVNAVFSPSETPIDADVDAVELPISTGGPSTFGQNFSHVAGFFPSESKARDVAHQLLALPGLEPTHCKVLSPGDARWWRFRRIARSWAPGVQSLDGFWASARGMPMLCIAMAVALAWAGWAVFETVRSSEVGVLSLMASIAALVFVLICALLACLYGPGLGMGQPHHRRFDRHVRRQLAKGRWVVVVHGTPSSHCGAVGALVLEHSLKWCVISADRYRL